MYSSWLKDVHDNVAAPALVDVLLLPPHQLPKLDSITFVISKVRASGSKERGGEQKSRRAMSWRSDALFLERLTAMTPNIIHS